MYDSLMLGAWLEAFWSAVDFEIFRGDLVSASAPLEHGATAHRDEAE
jgi:hypothetical protein